MCGIAGLFEYKNSHPVSEQLLKKMTDSLAHRGPDAEGIYISGPIGLGHRRLSILDLSEHGNQPMKILDGRMVITYNGEIYNYIELREELTQRGHKFFSTSDTEVIIRAYHEWGAECLKKLSGIFAFAVWDEQEQTLFLARDHLGVKPLFYSIDSKVFRFGSEIKAILCDPRVKCDFSDEGLDAFFTFGYSTTPITGLQAIQQLLPGHYAKVDANGIEINQYWKIPYQEKQVDKPFDELLSEYESIFNEVVRRQLRSDVPVGVFISGGLDSSAVALSINQLNRQDVTGFSVGFTESSFNELPFARQVAGTLGIQLIEENLDFNAVELIQEVSKFSEEPTADSSMIAVYLLCKMTSRHLKVALSGDGADEILAGYETYRANQLATYYRMIPSIIRRSLIKPAVRSIPISNRKYNLHQLANRFVNGAETGPGRDHCCWRIMFDNALKDRLYTENFRSRTHSYDPVGRYFNALEGPPEHLGALAGYLNADTTFYLPNDMLIKIDRMSMAHGLEVRVPFLDIDMVTFCMNLPPDFKLHKGKIRKHILRQSLRGKLPQQILDRPKSGFNIPVEHWMRQIKLKELLFDLIRKNDNSISEYLKIDQVEQLWSEHYHRRKDYGHVLFTILMFALWCRNIKSRN
jgi:asparagine synthase (glutamine-hydrolysing)